MNKIEYSRCIQKLYRKLTNTNYISCCAIESYKNASAGKYL